MSGRTAVESHEAVTCRGRGLTPQNRDSEVWDMSQNALVTRCGSHAVFFSRLNSHAVSAERTGLHGYCISQWQAPNGDIGVQWDWQNTRTGNAVVVPAHTYSCFIIDHTPNVHDEKCRWQNTTQKDSFEYCVRADVWKKVNIGTLGLMDRIINLSYPRRARSAIGVDTVFTLDVCLYVCIFVCLYVSALERKRLIGMTWNSEP